MACLIYFCPVQANSKQTKKKYINFAFSAVKVKLLSGRRRGRGAEQEVAHINKISIYLINKLNSANAALNNKR